MPACIPSENEPKYLGERYGVENELYLDHLNYWLVGVQQRYTLIAEDSRSTPGLDSSGDFWERLAKIENTDESRERVCRVVQMVSRRETAELNRILADYICIPWVGCGKEDRLEVRFDSVDPSYEILHGHPEIPRLCRFPAEEVMAVLSVLHLAQAGFLHKLRVCPICRVAFISSKRTCSTKCSKRLYASTPKERARRAAVARAKYDRLFGVPKRRRAKDAQ
ncbi:MAG: hypothetical protein ACLQG3_16255 [Terracidiphilus sp.]